MFTTRSSPIRRPFWDVMIPRDPEKFVIGRTESGQDSLRTLYRVAFSSPLELAHSSLLINIPLRRDEHFTLSPIHRYKRLLFFPHLARYTKNLRQADRESCSSRRFEQTKYWRPLWSCSWTKRPLRHVWFSVPLSCSKTNVFPQLLYMPSHIFYMSRPLWAHWTPCPSFSSTFHGKHA